MTYTVTPIREDFLCKIRETGLDDLGQPVRPLVAQGGEPCRDALRRARPGERIILASYCPFSRPGPYREYGPVFALANKAEGSAAPIELPVPKKTAEDYWKPGAKLVLRAYSAEEDIVAAKLVRAEEIGEEVAEYFARDDVDFALLRFAAYGCYALRLDRNRQ